MRRRIGQALLVVLLLGAACARADNPTLESLQRDVTVVAFWATWCGPCREELPKLAALQRRYAGDEHVRVVAVSVDHGHKARAARKMAAQAGVAEPMITDGEKLYFRYFKSDDTDVPALAVIDRRARGATLVGGIAGQSSDDFVAMVAGAIDAVRAGQPRAPAPWQPLGW